MAHFPAPSIAECLAGAMAAKDILLSHSIHAPGSLPTCISLLRALMPAVDHNQNSLDVEMPKRLVLFSVATQALDKFAAEVGGKARSVWSDKTKLPTDLSEVSGLIKCLQAQNGRNQQLTHWTEYKNWIYVAVKSSLETIKIHRNTMYHEPIAVSAEMVFDLLRSNIRVLAELGMDQSSLEQLLKFVHVRCVQCSDSVPIPFRVSRQADATAVGMQIGFSARKLTGRDSLIAAVADDILERAKRGEHSRTALTGQSGVGKTVLAREICNRLLDVLPLQTMLLGTSSGTLRMELARLGRAFTPSLPEQCDEAQAVEAARRFLASSTGYVLLLDDAVDMDEVWSLEGSSNCTR